MFALIYKILSFGLNIWGNYQTTKATTDVQKEQIKADVEKNKDSLKAAVLMNGAWWFQLFFILPLALWFSGVVIYSLFWCRTCIYPQPWSIAALPAPLNEWAAWIIGFLFLVNVGARK